jgi:F-type H+-transporting ATPase subunit b
MAIYPDPWLMFLHAIPFFLTMVVLHVVLFKPMLAYLGDRDKAIVGSREDAERLEIRAEEKLAEYETAIAKARSEAASERAEARAAAMKKRDGSLTAARKDAEEKISQALVEIQKERDVAAKELGTMSMNLAEDISTQVLSEARAQQITP